MTMTSFSVRDVRGFAWFVRCRNHCQHIIHLKNNVVMTAICEKTAESVCLQDDT